MRTLLAATGVSGNNLSAMARFRLPSAGVRGGATVGVRVRIRRGVDEAERRKRSLPSSELVASLDLRLFTSLLRAAVLLATLFSIISILALSSWQRCSTSTRGVSVTVEVRSRFCVLWFKLESFSASEVLSDRALDRLERVEGRGEEGRFRDRLATFLLEEEGVGWSRVEEEGWL